MNRRTRYALSAAGLLLLVPSAEVCAQSSSLYLPSRGQQRAQPQQTRSAPSTTATSGNTAAGDRFSGAQSEGRRSGDRARRRPAVRRTSRPSAPAPAPPKLHKVSYTAVAPPQPRSFSEHDLVTIIIREQASASSEATLETEKETTVEGEVGAFPRFRLKDLLEAQLSNSDEADLPSVDVSGTNEFEGDGEYERTDSMTTRLTARVVDVKPNGTLALEARTELKNDEEELTVKVTGYCRADDVSADNTILSTQIFDLRVSKQHKGELRDAADKGFITKILEGIFNF